MQLTCRVICMGDIAALFEDIMMDRVRVLVGLGEKEEAEVGEGGCEMNRKWSLSLGATEALR